MAAAEIGVTGAIFPPWTAVAGGWRNRLSHEAGEVPSCTETGKGQPADLSGEIAVMGKRVM